MNHSQDLIDHLENIRLALYAVFAALAYIGLILTVMFGAAAKRGRALAASAAAKQFQADAQELLSKTEYAKLKEAAAARRATHPGDVTVQYYLGMAHLRCEELVDAKRCFEVAMKLDTQWKKLCTVHLAEIEVALKKSKPTLVQ